LRLDLPPEGVNGGVEQVGDLLEGPGKLAERVEDILRLRRDTGLEPRVVDLGAAARSGGE
jgi:hypothetical protein